MGQVAAMSLLETQSLTKRFAGLTAVNDVSFHLEKGRVRGLIGPNGAGKTTLVSLLCGRIEPTEGCVQFEGRDITHLPAHKRIQAGMAYTFQITSVFGDLSVEENVALAARRRWKDLGSRVTDAIERVGLPDELGTLAGELSYGHQRLLEVAMGVVQAPKLLIMDEPTQGLSDSEIAGFKTLVRDVAREATVLLIEHNMSVVMELADDITVLNFGEILAEGTPDEVRSNRDVQTAYLGAG